MQSRFPRFSAGVFLALAACGCQHRSAPPSTRPISFKLNAVPTPGDPTPHSIYVAQVDVYQIDVPVGAVSGNSAFWGKIDQENIDPRQEELLAKNGFHVGQGRVEDWPFFRRILEQNPAHTRVTSRIAYQEQREIVLTRADQPPMNLFYYDDAGHLIGRSFDATDDEILLSFWPTPRHNGQVHVQLLPCLRGTQEQIRAAWANGQEQIQRLRPEFFYDLKLESDIDVNHFLIVAPSAEAKMSSSFGNAFLVDKSKGTRTETILIVVARPIGAETLVRKTNAE